MSRHNDAANAATRNNSTPVIDWTAVSEPHRITTTEQFRSQYMCETLPSSFAG